MTHLTEASNHDSGDSERLRLFISRIADYAIYMLSPEGRVASWNAGAERFKGYAADEIIGQHFSRFYTEEDRAAGVPARALATALGEGKFEAEGWRARKDGSRFWASVVIDPIRNDAGELLGFAKITRDVTAKREAEEALRPEDHLQGRRRHHRLAVLPRVGGTGRCGNGLCSRGQGRGRRRPARSAGHGRRDVPHPGLQRDPGELGARSPGDPRAGRRRAPAVHRRRHAGHERGRAGEQGARFRRRRGCCSLPATRRPR